MNILLCGATGFIGRHLAVALEQAGHHVVSGMRRTQQINLSPSATELSIDYTKDTDSKVWESRLQQLRNIDIVINAVGILNQSENARFAEIHRDAPIALFDAAQRFGLTGIVQISALGGNDEGQASTQYMQTKRAADAHLMQLPCPHLVVRPSLVVGLDGDSSRLFRTLASLPVIALPGKGEQQMQPAHIDDLCQAIINWLANTGRRSMVLNAVGPRAISYREMLATYRSAMGLAPAFYLPIPMSVMRLTARVATLLPQKVLAPETLHMLEQDNVAAVSDFAAQLGYQPKGNASWFSGVPTGMLAAEAIDSWITPVFRLVLALIWLVTGALSLGIYPLQSSLSLLTPLGLSGGLASMVLIATATLDIGIGLATLVKPSRILWLLQIGLIFTYTLVVGIFLPDFLLHPFGPILKNLAIFCLLIHLYASEKK